MPAVPLLAVTGVVRVSAQIQMLKADTRAIVAVMQHAEAVRNRPAFQCPRESVSVPVRTLMPDLHVTVAPEATPRRDGAWAEGHARATSRASLAALSFIDSWVSKERFSRVSQERYARTQSAYSPAA